MPRSNIHHHAFVFSDALFGVGTDNTLFLNFIDDHDSNEPLFCVLEGVCVSNEQDSLIFLCPLDDDQWFLAPCGVRAFVDDVLH